MSTPGVSFNDEEIDIPLVVPHGKMIVSYDMGGTLFKLAYTAQSTKDQTKIKLRTFNNLDLDKAIAFIKKEVVHGVKPEDVILYASGIGSRTYKEKIENELGFKDAILTDEFVSFHEGFKFMLKHLEESQYLHPYTDMPIPTREQMGIPNDLTGVSPELEMDMRADSDKFPAILVFCGSGMGFMLVKENEKPILLGGCSTAGMMFNALGRHLTGAKSYEELMELASRGNAAVLTTTLNDLNVADSTYCNVEFRKMAEVGDMDATNFELFPFGNLIRNGLADPSKEDLARSLLHMVGNQIMLWSSHLCTCSKLNKVYLSGTFFANNTIVKEYLARMPMQMNMMGWPVRPRFLKYEGYTGVLGAIFGHLQAESNKTTKI